MSDKDSQVMIKIPEQLITDMVRAEMVRALGDQTKLIEGVVRAAMNRKKDSYSRTTIFEEQVAEMIQNVATETFREWLAEHRAAIKKTLMNELTANKGQHIKELVDSLIDGLSEWHITAFANYKHIKPE